MLTLVAGTRGQHHLSTFEIFHGHDGWLIDLSNPVVQACLMVHVHFEIYQGLLNPGNLQIDYQGFILPTLASPTDDFAWGNQIVWLCARILQWVERGLGTTGEWLQLTDLVDEWERQRPTSFDAFFFREEDAEAARYFPEAWFMNPCHGTPNRNVTPYIVANSVDSGRQPTPAHLSHRACGSLPQSRAHGCTKNRVTDIRA